jgi:hypothetical protein
MSDRTAFERIAERSQEIIAVEKMCVPVLDCFPLWDRPLLARLPFGKGIMDKGLPSGWGFNELLLLTP